MPVIYSQIYLPPNPVFLGNPAANPLARLTHFPWHILRAVRVRLPACPLYPNRVMLSANGAYAFPALVQGLEFIRWQVGSRAVAFCLNPVVAIGAVTVLPLQIISDGLWEIRCRQISRAVMVWVGAVDGTHTVKSSVLHAYIFSIDTPLICDMQRGGVGEQCTIGYIT